MARLQVHALGPLTVLIDDTPVALGGRKQRAVLAQLTLHANRVVSADQLMDVVWGDDLPKKPGSVLQVYAANLRRVLDPMRTAGSDSRLVTAGGGYRLIVSPEEVDLLVFDRSITDAGSALTAGNLAEAAETLRSGLAHWRGAAFPDLADGVEVQAELAALDERRLGAVEDLLELDLSLGRHADVAARASELVARYPFRERLRAAHIAALYRGQRQSDALAACRAARRFLADELGAAPGPELRELERAVLRHDPALQRSARVGARRRQRLDNLPAALSSFVGRQLELEELRKLLTDVDVRLLTLTGPGGTGKTRIAMAAAAMVEASFQDGACWVALDTVSATDQVLGAVADALGVRSAPEDELKAVTTALLRPLRMLLVLDNFEHVLGAWPIVTALLETAPRLTVLVSSRVPLHVSGEQLFEVPQLGLPPSGSPMTAAGIANCEAVQLFSTRAALVKRQFRVDNENAAPVAALCRQLDGLPLAIELAAARAAEYPPIALLAALEDVLGILADGPRDAAERQRTLRGAIAWSYHLLSQDQQAVFSGLAVFAGAPDLEAIRAVAATRQGGPAVESTLDVLVQHSLLRRDAAGGQVRYPMLRTVQAYAAERLTASGDQTDHRRRHANYYLAFAGTNAGQLEGPQQVQAFARLHAERSNVDAALNWAAGARGDGGDLPVALRLVGQLWPYWQISGDIEVPRRCTEDVLRRGHRLDPAVRAPALSGAGTLCWLNGDADAARDYHQQAVDIYRQLDDGAGTAWSTLCIAVQDVVVGDLDSASDSAQKALTLGRAAEHPRSVASALTVLGVIATYRGEGARAEELQQSALAIARSMGDRWLAGKVLINLSDIAESLGEWNRATEYVQESLHVSQQIGDKALAIFGLEAMAELRLRFGAPRTAARLLGAAHSYRTNMAQPLIDYEREQQDAIIEQIRTATGQVSFAIAWAEGEALSLEQAVEDAIASATDQRQPPLMAEV